MHSNKKKKRVYLVLVLTYLGTTIYKISHLDDKICDNKTQFVVKTLHKVVKQITAASLTKSP